MMLFRRLRPYALFFLGVQTLLRLTLGARAMVDAELTGGNWLSLMLRGIWLDVVTAGFCLLPVALYALLLPRRFQGGGLDRRLEAGLRFLFAFLVLFDAVAEHLFWTEFTTRFNFIAVDYLIYTQEVVGNIAESYPLGWLLAGIAGAAAAWSWLSLRYESPPATPVASFGRRAMQYAALLAACAALYAGSSIEQAQVADNSEAGELAANGIYNLFYAFWHNEISYDRFYAKRPEAEVALQARKLMWEEESDFLHPNGADLTHVIPMKGPELHKNVIVVVMESMSADYMGAFGNQEHLTPNLDALARDGLFFTDLYATGTRTVRGLEAVALSIPPTPGQSILRRPDNAGLFSLGYVFQDRGYDTRFIYGGYGYFDNMSEFFSHNGFDVIDRTQMDKDKIQFANVWGVSDEDEFGTVLAQADASFAAKKPFMHLVMTTSNHRPYTYPEGRIDLPSHSGRQGGVKYADYSIGKLIEQARTKPWFKDTVFVFVADHTAGAGGKAELNPEKYHIPMIFYAPGFIPPQRFAHTASQIDLGPILLGQLNFSYNSRFYGEDLMHDEDEIPHAFISNYQKVGLIRDGKLTVLSPKRRIQHFDWPKVAQAQESEAEEGLQAVDAITYYQSASWWKTEFRRIPTLLAQPTLRAKK